MLLMIQILMISYLESVYGNEVLRNMLEKQNAPCTSVDRLRAVSAVRCRPIGDCRCG